MARFAFWCGKSCLAGHMAADSMVGRASPAGSVNSEVVSAGSHCVNDTEKVAWQSMPVSSVKRCLW